MPTVPEKRLSERVRLWFRWVQKHSLLSGGIAGILFTLTACGFIWANLNALERDQEQEYQNMAAKIGQMTTNCVVNSKYDDLLDVMQLQTQSSSVKFIAFHINGVRVLQSGKEPAATASVKLLASDNQTVQSVKRSKYLCLDQVLPYRRENQLSVLRIVFSFEEFDNRRAYILLGSVIIVALASGLLVVLSLLTNARSRSESQNRVLVETQEQLHRQEKMKTLMIQSLAHNVNNYLNIIAVRIESLRSQRKAGKPLGNIERDLDIMNENNRAIFYLVKNLNDHERLSKGEVTVSMAWEDLAGLARNIARSFETSLAKKNITLKVSLPDTLSVWLDARVVDQVLMNLVINGINYSAPNTVMELWAQMSESQVEVYIRDQGPGIVPEAWERIFEPFVRLNKEGPKGSGLGLTNSRQLIRQLGGDLRVFASHPGVGTTFLLTLPLQPVPLPLPEAATAEGEGQ
jgi:signal transduction histidine kinase